MSIKIEHTEVYGLEAAIRGMRNPMNSWNESDSFWEYEEDTEYEDGVGYRNYIQTEYRIGPKDYVLMKKLAKAGPDHGKYLRMITVTTDIEAPLYWWKEYDTYKVGTVANSCSTMHKIHEKEFTLEDFSHEHLTNEPYNRAWITNAIVDEDVTSPHKVWATPLDILKYTIEMLNLCRMDYLETKNKSDWWQIIQLLPSSYNQRRTVQLNYAVLKNIYPSRKNHKLDEWHDFCAWISTLPYSELITE